MRVCLIGKYPPIEGGVCMQNYWSAHALAGLGHEVHVVTNAKEVGSLHRMYMRPEDWARCEAHDDGGSVTIHWTEHGGTAHFYIPDGNPIVTKLTTIVLNLHRDRPFDVILSYYLEPYAVAGHIASQITGVPHIVRMAGSDAGRLWRQPQLEALYDHVLRSAAFIIIGRAVTARAKERGIAPERVAALYGYPAPEELFTADGPPLDLVAFRRNIESDPDPAMHDLAWGAFDGTRPYFGVLGKLGQDKGTFSLLEAMQRVKQAGIDVGLVVVGHGHNRQTEEDFRNRVQALDLVDRVLQLPFLPHWRVAEFMRGCLAVCCLEQDFPIVFHLPVIAFETLLAGRCLVASTELVRKIPGYERLPSGYGCIALENVNDVGALSRALMAIARDPAPVEAIGLRGQKFARAAIKNSPYAGMLEKIVVAAAQRSPLPRATRAGGPSAGALDGFRLARLAATEMRAEQPATLDDARKLLGHLEVGITKSGGHKLASLIPAVRLEIVLAEAQETLDSRGDVSADPLYRLRTERWAMGSSDLARLRPVTPPDLTVLSFDFDLTPYSRVQQAADLPAEPPSGSSHLVLFASSNKQSRDPLLVDALTARILRLSDGCRTTEELAQLLENEEGHAQAKSLEWVEELFVAGLLGLWDDQCLAKADSGTGLRA